MPALYHLFIGTSKTLAILAVATVGLYGIGDCIFTGLFSINTNESS
ncbi:membrane protein [Enterococcus xinjiangensis]|nr:membrane protein [Enterococcus lactis]MBL4993260.1 membrane protein [Enterococcus lactis]